MQCKSCLAAWLCLKLRALRGVLALNWPAVFLIYSAGRGLLRSCTSSAVLRLGEEAQFSFLSTASRQPSAAAMQGCRTMYGCAVGIVWSGRILAEQAWPAALPVDFVANFFADRHWLLAMLEQGASACACARHPAADILRLTS